MEAKKNILLIEDDLQIVEYLTSFLPLLGDYEIDRVLNEIDALARINAYEPELAILNLDTPGINTRKIFDEIKKRHKKTGLLAMGANREELKTWKEQGVEGVLLKPLDLTELSVKVKKLLPCEGESREKEKSEYARLLIADDEPEINQFLKEEIFEPLGIEVYTACDGEEALRIFKEKECNLVLLDLKMPKINGYGLIKLLEASNLPPKPKAIVIETSALGEPLSEVRRYDYPVLEKPLDLERLRQTIFEVCTEHQLHFKNQKREG